MPVTPIASSRRALVSVLPILLIVSMFELVARPAACETVAGVVTEWPLAEFKEPSGVVYHAGRRSIFICGDEGDVGEVSLSGKLLRSAHVGGDLEAITVVPETGLLYVVREGHEIMLELDPADFTVTRRFNIQRQFGGNADYLQRGGNGVEGLTFVPDAKHPEGGRFFAVNQDDPPALVELAVPLKSLQGKFGDATVARAHELSVRPLSGIVWQPEQRTFLISSALWKAVYVVGEDGQRLATVRLPGLMQEGIARLPDGAFVIVQDVGGLLRWDPGSDPFVVSKDEKVGQ